MPTTIFTERLAENTLNYGIVVVCVPKRHSADPHAPPTKTTACCGGSQEQIPVKPDVKDSHTKAAQGSGARNRQTTYTQQYYDLKYCLPIHCGLKGRATGEKTRLRQNHNFSVVTTTTGTPSERDYRHPLLLRRAHIGVIVDIGGIKLKGEKR